MPIATRSSSDNPARAGTDAASLAKLRPVFKRDGGSVTAGNASTINDGAAALLICDAGFAKAHGLDIRAEITGYGTGAREPREVMIAPVNAVTRLLERIGGAVGDFDLVELGFDPDKTNIRGGGVSLGHPIGCSGARILVTLLHALEDTGGEQGLATLCLGGGGAVALTIRRT